MVRVKGLEPPRLAAPEPKSGASTNSATPASGRVLAKLGRGSERENGVSVLRRYRVCIASVLQRSKVTCASKVQIAKHLGQYLGQILGNQTGAEFQGAFHMQPGGGFGRLHRIKSARQKAGDETGQHVA